MFDKLCALGVMLFVGYMLFNDSNWVLCKAQAIPEPITFREAPETGFLSLSQAQLDFWRANRESMTRVPWLNTKAWLQVPAALSTQQTIANWQSGEYRQHFSELPYLIVEVPENQIRILPRQSVRISCAQATQRSAIPNLIQALPYFPEINIVTVDNPGEEIDLQELLVGLRSLPYLRSFGVVGQRSLTIKEMESLVEHESLRGVSLISHEPQPALSLLSKTPYLRYVAISSSSGPVSILDLAELPNISALVVAHPPWDDTGNTDQSMNVPISEDIAAAIESLDGRLKTIVFEQYVPVHPSIVRAFSKVRSLERIEMDEVGYGLRMDDIASFAELDNLTKFSISQHPSQSDLQHPGYEEMMQLKASIRQRAEERRQERVQRTMQEVEQQKSQATESVVEREDD